MICNEAPVLADLEVCEALEGHNLCLSYVEVRVCYRQECCKSTLRSLPQRSEGWLMRMLSSGHAAQ